MAPKYYLLHEGKVLGRVDDPSRMKGSVFRPDGWVRADHVAAKVTGQGGDSDFEEIDEAKAKKLFPAAFRK